MALLPIVAAALVGVAGLTLVSRRRWDRRADRIALAVLTDAWPLRWRLRRALRRAARELTGSSGADVPCRLVVVQAALNDGRSRGDVTVLHTSGADVPVIQLALTLAGRRRTVDDVLSAFADEYLRAASDGALAGPDGPASSADRFRQLFRTGEGARDAHRSGGAD